LLDRIGSRIVLFVATLLVTVGMFVVAFVGASLWLFYLSALLVGLGLGALLGAPLRYVMLNETRASERASAQGILSLNTSVGQLIGGALVGAVAASLGGGTSGYVTAFIAVGLVMLLMTATTVGLKGRADEIEAAQRNHAGVDAQRA
jgi:MFS family permease